MCDKLDSCLLDRCNSCRLYEPSTGVCVLMPIDLTKPCVFGTVCATATKTWVGNMITCKVSLDTM